MGRAIWCALLIMASVSTLSTQPMMGNYMAYREREQAAAAMSLTAGPSACVDPLLNVPVAVKRCFWPTAIEAAVGVTATVCSVGGAAMATSVTRAAHSTSAVLARNIRVVRLQ